MKPLALAADAANYGVCMEFGWVGQVVNWAVAGSAGVGKTTRDGLGGQQPRRTAAWE